MSPLGRDRSISDFLYQPPLKTDNRPKPFIRHKSLYVLKVPECNWNRSSQRYALSTIAGAGENFGHGMKQRARVFSCRSGAKSLKGDDSGNNYQSIVIMVLLSIIITSLPGTMIASACD